jgi:hypothetical protein
MKSHILSSTWFVNMAKRSTNGSYMVCPDRQIQQSFVVTERTLSVTI